MTEAHDSSKNAETRPKPRRRRRFLRFSLFFLILLLILAAAAVLFGPAIASRFAPGFIENAMNRSISGEIDVGSVELSWRGPQRVESIELRDSAGNVVANATIDAKTSLLDLLRGSRDAGVITLAGKAAFAGADAGVLAALRPPPPAPGEPVPPAGAPGGGPSRLPRGFGVEIVFDGVEISYVDDFVRQRMGGPIGLTDLRGRAAFEVGGAAVVKATADAIGGDGGVDIDLTIDGLSAPDGMVTVEQARVNGDASLRLGPRFAALLGDRAADASRAGVDALEVKLVADASSAGGRFEISASSGGDGPRADAALLLRDGRLTLEPPATASARIGPDLWTWLAGEDAPLQLSEPVTVSATVTELAATIDDEDLRSAALNAEVRFSEIRGALRRGGSSEAVAIVATPAPIVVSAERLADGVSARGGATVRIGERAAGELGFDVAVRHVLDDRGRLALGAATRVTGRIEADDAPLALLETFGFGADDVALARRTIGESIDGVITAQTGEGGRIDASLEASSERANAAAESLVSDERIDVQGASVSATITPEAASALLRRFASGGAAERVPLSAPARVTFALDPFTLPRGEDGGIVFAPASASASATQGAARDGLGVSGSVRSPEMALDFTGAVGNMTDASGALASDGAVISLNAEGEAPAAVLDALAGAGGLLAEALGGAVRTEIRAQDLSKSSGTLSASVYSPRAILSVEGSVRDGAFVASAPVRAEVSTISPRLGEMALSTLLPLIGHIEKRTEDGAALVVAEEFTAPIDGDLRRLNGRLTISLGRVRYEAAPFFGKLIRLTDNPTTSLLFNNWPELKVTITDGVATYERVALPMGDFTLETKGTVDLAERTVDIITYVPLSALVREIAEAAGRVPGIRQATLIPLRTRGKFGALKTEPALEMILEDQIKNPEGILEDLFKRLGDEIERKRG